MISEALCRNYWGTSNEAHVVTNLGYQETKQTYTWSWA